MIDEIVDVQFDDAIEVARELATREGILAGMSAGAAVWAALEIAARPESAGKRIVVIVPDAGGVTSAQRYSFVGLMPSFSTGDPPLSPVVGMSAPRMPNPG